MPPQPVKESFSGTVTAVKARIRLLRSFDQTHHAYQGYTLLLDGTLDGESADELRVGIGPKAHEKHQFRIGDQVTGLAVPVPGERQEWATHYKVSKLRLGDRGPGEQAVPANPDGGIAPPLPEYRARGHRRLDKSTYSKSCQRCPFGLVMATEITIDQWKPEKKQWTGPHTGDHMHRFRPSRTSTDSRGSEGASPADLSAGGCSRSKPRSQPAPIHPWMSRPGWSKRSARGPAGDSRGTA